MTAEKTAHSNTHSNTHEGARSSAHSTTRTSTCEARISAAAHEGARSSVLALTLSYEGTCYHGFARQPSTLTVQGELELALQVLLRREVLTVCAGRTDAGVHGLGQVVSFEVAEQELEGRSLEKLQRSLNALTPADIVVRRLEQKPAGFSARFNAVEREYRYRIVTGSVPPVFLAKYAWWLPLQVPLDVTAMREAALLLLGEHDFSSFCVKESIKGKSPVRTLTMLHLFGADHLGEHCTVVQVCGNAFLQSMVRVIVGSLVEVGLRNKPPEWIGEVLAAHDRSRAGQTAPPQGLTLWEVRY
ncbi:MAG: tRNA pseudouridine(38-40) synthase TruA [Coriobacteriales bacterium]|jgi:tRNA pseudouridine38-40 synthase|nr:tRNA pseudouridine(38-40) synthase TruA [Coriobacteriales bacterium]